MTTPTLIDKVAVQRAADGHRVTLTDDEVREAALHMATAGYSPRKISARLSVYENTIKEWIAEPQTQETPPAPSNAWRDKAACREEDPELFFPVGGTGPAALQIEEAKSVCRRCPVMGQCLQWALDSGQDAGVWGGLSEDERRAMKHPATRAMTTVTGPVTLYPQDKKILAAHAAGLTREEIALKFGITLRTLSRRMCQIRKVLGVSDEQLAEAGRAAGLLPAPKGAVAA